MIKIETYINKLKGQDEHIKMFIFQIFLLFRVRMIHELINEFNPISTLNTRDDKAMLEVSFKKQL
jgi:hypothetical protein